MQIALEEARKGVGLTSPNPPVGAVIVRDGKIISTGWHRRAGLPHAEREALSALPAEDARGATIYVTLEPCSTRGRTGACTDALIEAKVSKVVYGSRDPNPKHAGNADRILAKEGIEVVSGVLRKECDDLIRGFAMVQKRNRPWVIAKTAMSLDGRINRPPGEGQWLSGPRSREAVHQFRGEVDAILTSGETLRRDNPALTLRSKERPKEKIQPWRVVVSRGGIERKGFQLFEDEWKDRTLVFEGRPMYDILSTLASDHDVCTLLLESGGTLLGQFHDEGLVDEWVIYLTPLVCGGPSVALGGTGAGGLEERLSLEELSITRIDDDLCARGVVRRKGRLTLERLGG